MNYAYILYVVRWLESRSPNRRALCLRWAGGLGRGLPRAPLSFCCLVGLGPSFVVVASSSRCALPPSPRSGVWQPPARHILRRRWGSVPCLRARVVANLTEADPISNVPLKQMRVPYNGMMVGSRTRAAGRAMGPESNKIIRPDVACGYGWREISCDARCQ
jgi:hypothetical protein